MQTKNKQKNRKGEKKRKRKESRLCTNCSLFYFYKFIPLPFFQEKWRASFIPLPREMVSFSILSLWRMVVIVGRLDRITSGKWCELCGVFMCVWFQFDCRRKWVAGRRLTSLHPSARRLYRWTPSSTAHSVTTRSHAKSNCRSSIWIMKQKTIFSFFSSSFPVTLFSPPFFLF